MVSFVIAGEWQTLIFISSCPFEGSVFLFPTFKKATPCITSYITLALWQSRKQSRYLSRKCDLAIKVCPIYLEPGFNERVKQFRPENHHSSDPDRTIFCTLRGKGMLNICSKPFLDFQFEFITSVLGLERNHRERTVNLSLHCVRRAADYSWEHWRLNIQAQHLNMLLLLIYFIDIVWIEVNIQIALCCHAV